MPPQFMLSMSFSAEAERGVIVHLQSSRCLGVKHCHVVVHSILDVFSYTTSPEVLRGSTWILCPWLSSGGQISRVCSTEAIVMKSVASAYWRPGQALKADSIQHAIMIIVDGKTNLRPKPYMYVAGSCPAEFTALSSMNLSGTNFEGSG